MLPNIADGQATPSGTLRASHLSVEKRASGTASDRQVLVEPRGQLAQLCLHTNPRGQPKRLHISWVSLFCRRRKHTPKSQRPHNSRPQLRAVRSFKCVLPLKRDSDHVFMAAPSQSSVARPNESKSFLITHHDSNGWRASAAASAACFASATFRLASRRIAPSRWLFAAWHGVQSVCRFSSPHCPPPNATGTM